MQEINMVFDDTKGEALRRFASLAGKTERDLIMDWISDKLDYAAVTAFRAGGDSWEAVAKKLDVSVTQVRRIYVRGMDFPTISKDDVRVLENYVDGITELNDVLGTLKLPSEEDLKRVNELFESLEGITEMGSLNLPGEEDLERVNDLCCSLETASENSNGIPSEEDRERLREMVELTERLNKRD